MQHDNSWSEKGKRSNRQRAQEGPRDDIFQGEASMLGTRKRVRHNHNYGTFQVAGMLLTSLQGEDTWHF